jgi:hypothetical protein
MKPILPPSPLIACAQVIAYLIIDDTMQWTGRLTLYVGGKQLGAVPCLAIARNVLHDRDEYLIFHCDRCWNSLGTTSAASIKECKLAVERWYAGSHAKWLRTGITKREAEQQLRLAFAGQTCTFCRCIPPQVDAMLSFRGKVICDECVKAMAEMLNH